MRKRSSLVSLLAGLCILGSMGSGPCVNRGPNFFGFLSPRANLLTEPGTRRVQVMIPAFSRKPTLQVLLNGSDVTASFAWDGRIASAQLAIGDGPQHLEATIQRDLDFLGSAHTATDFEAVTLNQPDICEVLNDAECVLPFPSSRYQVSDPTSETGVRMAYPEGALPAISAGSLGNLLAGSPQPLDPSVYNYYDGVSPTVQPIMHFPGGVDLAASDAPRLLEATRNFDLHGLDADSPSVLLDAGTGERIAHFVENDAHATGQWASRQATIIRPGKSLTPGHRYIVAMRNLVAPGGGAVAPEPAFRTLRDGAPTTIAGVEARRDHFDTQVFPVLAAHGVPRANLVLAFDFTVASTHDLTSEMLSMRDQAFAWLATQDPASLFTVTQVTPLSDCASPDDFGWREVRGTFRVPNFLTQDGVVPADPVLQPNTLGFLNGAADGSMIQFGFIDAPFGIAIPCSAKNGALPGLVLGHGLFGSGPDFPRQLLDGLGDQLPGFIASGLLPPGSNLDFVAAGTNWSGLSELEVPPLPDHIPGDIGEIFNDPVLLAQVFELVNSFIGQIFIDFNQFQALPDRLRQGQLNTLVLARLMHSGVFNHQACFQRLVPEAPDCRADQRNDPSLGVLASGDETYFFGASLGGIMGLMFGALSPDVERVVANVPAINFSFLLQRSFAFAPFGDFLAFVEPDPLKQLLGLQVLHEIWVRGESAGYATHITSDPLPGTNAKHVLLTPGRFDSVVSPLGAQIAAATLGIPNLDGSIETNLPLVPDASGPLDSAMELYDTGGFVLGEDDAFIPPLANDVPSSDGGGCNPHGNVAVIPAAIHQLMAFLQPDGVIENFCNGLCDAEGPLELPNGNAQRCDPTP